MPNQPISLPAGYAPAFAIGYADATGELAIVEGARPLPVSLDANATLQVETVLPVAPAPLEGQATQATVAGPFAPVGSKPVLIQLAGSWSGVVQVQRSVDAGVTRHDLSAGGAPWGSFTNNACEVVWAEEEAGAELYLNITVDSGTLEYRLSQ